MTHNLLHLHHIGVAVPDLERAIETYVAMGHSLVTKVDDTPLDVRVAFLAPNQAELRDDVLIELLAPLSDEGPLVALIKRRMLPSPYHTCYATNDITLAIDSLRDVGFIPVAPIRPALAMGGARMTFLYSQIVGLVELVEKPKLRGL